jgi:hypothetical protein
LWESMSPPSFENPSSIDEGFFVLSELDSDSFVLPQS